MEEIKFEMHKIQRFLYSKDDQGEQYIVHTRDPLAIFFFDILTKRFKLLTCANSAKAAPGNMEGLTDRVNDWYIFTIKAKEDGRSSK